MGRRSRTAHSVDVCDERNLWCDKVKKLVQKTCQAKGIEIKKEGGIEAAEIDRRMLVDRHYYSIASKAALKKPTELNIPMDTLKEFFLRRLGRGRRGSMPRMCVRTSNRRRRDERDSGKRRRRTRS